MIAVVIKAKEFEHMFTQFKKVCMHKAYGSIYWYSIVKRIGNVWFKHIGNVCLKCIGNVWLKHIGNAWLNRIGYVWLKHIGNIWLKRIGNVWLKHIGSSFASEKIALTIHNKYAQHLYIGKA